MALNTTSFTKCIEVPTSTIHAYINGRREIFIIRPTDPIDHPNAPMYDLGSELLNICDLRLLEEHEEIIFSFRILYDIPDPLERVGKIIIESTDDSNIILMPVSGHIDTVSRSRRDAVSIIFVLKPITSVDHQIVQQS